MVLIPAAAWRDILEGTEASATHRKNHGAPNARCYASRLTGNNHPCQWVAVLGRGRSDDFCAEAQGEAEVGRWEASEREGALLREGGADKSM